MSARTVRAKTRTTSIARILIWATFATLAAGVVVAIALSNRSVKPIDTEAPPFNPLAAGNAAPPFSVATTRGPFTLADAKKPVFLEVFATWCPHCQRETAVINRLYDRYKQQLDFVAVSGNQYANDRVSPESLADVLGFAQFFNVRYPIAYDGSLGVAKSYLQGGYPTIAIIGADKRISYIGSGEVGEGALAFQIRRALQK